MNHILNIAKRRKKLLVYFAFYLLLILGFFLNEDLSGGGKMDYIFQRNFIEQGFSNGIFDFLFDFYPTSTLWHHSPIYYTTTHTLNLIFNNQFLERFIMLHFFLPIPYFLFLCLKKKFKIDSNIYFLPLILFISPVFRSTIIWSGREIIAISLLSISLYYVYSYFESYDKKKIFLSFFLIALTIYFMPEYGLISILYFCWYYNFFDKKTLTKVILFNIILAFPFVWYFLNYIEISHYNIPIYKNLYTNIIFFFSTYFFYVIPFLLDKETFSKFIIYVKKNFIYFIIILFLFFLINETNKQILLGGGGFNQLLLRFNLENYIIIFSALGFLGHFFLTNKKVVFNLAILIVLIIQTCLNFYFFQKYLDLIFIIYFFLIFKINYLEILIRKKNFINNIIIFYVVYYIITAILRLDKILI